MPAMDPQAGSALNGLAADSRSLDQLRQAANQDPAKAVKQVAKQFEALFMQMVLKSMRDASPKSGMLDSSDQQTYTGMLDEQLAQKVAAGGTGLAEVIARQLSRNLPAATAGTAGAAAAPVSPAALLQNLSAATAVRTAKKPDLAKSTQDPAAPAVSQ
jgi:peptidoglycan hydrolase FlgJ